MIRTMEKVQSHCHIKQMVIEMVRYRTLKISEMRVTVEKDVVSARERW